MIHLCTCTGGSTSTISSSKSKRRIGTVSCKNCGGRSTIDGKSSSSCLLNTVLELTSLINSDFTWTKVSKGSRSSSRRPRRSNTISLTCGELLTNDSKGLEMPISESEKLGVSVLGCHFSEKAEHIPIKKRRFLFRASSPTRNPNTTSPKDSIRGLQFNPNASCLPAASEGVTGMFRRGSNDEKELVKAKKETSEDDDFFGISILAAAACSNSLGIEAELKENNTKPANICNQESDSHKSKTPDESISSQAPLELKNQDESMIQKSCPRDVRLNWDLNTVMDAWDEPFGSEHEVSATQHNVTSVEEKTIDCGVGSVSNVKLPVELKSLGHENKELKVENQKPDGYGEIREPFGTIPVTSNLSLENPACGTTFAKMVNPCVDTRLSIMDCSIPPGFDHCVNLRASKGNVGVSSTIVPTITTPSSTSTIVPTITTPSSTSTIVPTITTPSSTSEYKKHGLSLMTAASLEKGVHQSGVTCIKSEEAVKVKMELTSNEVVMEDSVNKGTDLYLSQGTDKEAPKAENQMKFGAVVVEEQPAATSSMPDAVVTHSNIEAEVPLENGFGYENCQGENQAGSGMERVDEVSVEYDSQYEDGELRGDDWNEGENEYVTDNKGDELDTGITDARETTSQCGQEKPTDIGSLKEADLTSTVVLPEKLHSSDEVSGSGPNEMNSGVQENNNERQDMVQQNANQSDEWKMNVSGWDLLPEGQRIASNSSTKTRTLGSRKFSYREEQKDEEMETMKGEGSRLYRKESLATTREVFVSRDRFRMQGCSSKGGEALSSRPERELRSFGRGRYSPPNRGSGRGGGMWNRSMLDDADTMTNEGIMDPIDGGRPSTYVPRRSFRSRSPMNREANDFRARLGLRPTGDTSHDRFMNTSSRGRGRGRSLRYVEGPRGRYHGPASDECDEFLPEYSHPFPRRRRCFSPVERQRGNNNNSYAGSRSPSRPRTRSPIGGFRRRSRSPNFRPDVRMRRPRSPPANYRRGFEPEYNPGPRNNNSSPPSSRWVNYKERVSVFDRRSSPPLDAPERERERERFSFYDSSRKPKQNEFYRSGHPGRFSELNEGGRGRPRYLGNDNDRPNNGYRRGFVRRYNMDGNGKRFHYEDEDGFGRGFDARDKHALEVLARGNSKPCSDSRFRDFPRRSREDKDGGGELKRRSREGKDPMGNEQESKEGNSEHKVKEQSTTTTSTTNVDSVMPNEAVKEGSN